jgi:hypothetical protein
MVYCAAIIQCPSLLILNRPSACNSFNLFAIVKRLFPTLNKGFFAYFRIVKILICYFDLFYEKNHFTTFTHLQLIWLQQIKH